MEKGDKPKKANPMKKVVKKVKPVKQKQKQTANQNVNVKVSIGGGGGGGGGKKRLLLPPELKQQDPLRRRRGPGAAPTPYPTSYQVPPPLAPHVVVRNHGDPVQTVASYSSSPIKIKEEKVTPDVKVKIEKKDSDKKKTTTPRNMTYKDFVKNKDSYDTSKNASSGYDSTYSNDSDTSMIKLGYHSAELTSDDEERRSPKKRSPLLRLWDPNASMSPIGDNSPVFTPTGIQNSTGGGSTISKIFSPLIGMTQADSPVVRKKGGAGGGSQKDVNFYAVHPELLDMSPTSQRKRADAIRAGERRAAAKNTSKVAPGDFDQIGNADIGAGFAGLMRNSYLQVKEDEDEEDLEDS